MGATKSADIVFRPKVWNDHIQAYFDRQMGLGSIALVDKTLEASPGETVSFPYWKAIGDAQEPAEDEGLAVDKLTDDSFSVTVKEVGKAIGWKDKAKRVSAAKVGAADSEAQRQMGRVFAEKVDKDIITTINTTGNYCDGYIATANTEVANVGRLIEGKITGFGDKSQHAVACAMHSYDYMKLVTDTTSGFLKADALDPLFDTVGFVGRIAGMALFVLDTMPEVSGGINGKKAYYHFLFKKEAFGIYMAQDLAIEKDRDILHRENLLAGTMWYGTLGLHGKVAATDRRIIRGAFGTALTI